MYMTGRWREKKKKKGDAEEIPRVRYILGRKKVGRTRVRSATRRKQRMRGCHGEKDVYIDRWRKLRGR